MGIGDLLGGGEALIKEEADLAGDVEGLAGVLGSAGPVGIARNTSGTLMILLESSLEKGDAGLDQESEVLGDPVLGSVAKKTDGLVEV